MEYNKRQFQKANDKKVLHKVRKNWVVMSMALLMAIGGKAAATHVSAHADTTNNNKQTNKIDTLKNRINESLVKSQSSSSNQNNRASASEGTAQDITKQASILHQRILQNADLSASRSVNGRMNNNSVSNIRNGSNHNTTAISAVNNDQITRPVTKVASTSPERTQPVQSAQNQQAPLIPHKKVMSGQDRKVQSIQHEHAIQKQNENRFSARDIKKFKRNQLESVIGKASRSADLHSDRYIYRAKDGTDLNSSHDAYGYSDYVWIPSDNNYVRINYGSNGLPDVKKMSSDDLNQISVADLKQWYSKYFNRLHYLQKNDPEIQSSHLDKFGLIMQARMIHDSGEKMKIYNEIFKKKHPQQAQQMAQYRAKVLAARQQRNQNASGNGVSKTFQSSRLGASRTQVAPNAKFGDSLPDHKIFNYDTALGDREWWTIYPSGDLDIHNGYYGGGYWSAANMSDEINGSDYPSVSNFSSDIYEESVNNEIVADGNFGVTWTNQPNLHYCFMTGNKFLYGRSYPMIARNMGGPNKSDDINIRVPKMPSSNNASDVNPSDDPTSDLMVGENEENTNSSEFEGDNNLQAVQFDPGLQWMDAPEAGYGSDASDAMVRAHMSDIQESGFTGLDLPHGTQWHDITNGDTNVNHIFNGDVWTTTDPHYAPTLGTVTIPVKIILCDNEGHPTGQTKIVHKTKQVIQHAAFDVNFADFNTIAPGYQNEESGQVSLYIKHDPNTNRDYYTDNGSPAHWINADGSGAVGSISNDARNPMLVIKMYHWANTGDFHYNSWVTGQNVNNYESSDLNRNVNITESDAKSLADAYRFADGYNGNSDEDHFASSDNQNNIDHDDLYVTNQSNPYNFNIPVVDRHATNYGTWGTAHWALDSDGTLVIGNGGNRNATLGGPIESTNLAGLMSKIKKVEFVNSVNAPQNSTSLFNRLSDVKSYHGFNEFNTSSVTSMDNMFANNKQLSDLDVSSFNTNEVRSMDSMFKSDSDLQSLNASDLNVTNVSDMTDLFMNDHHLKFLNINDWNTSKASVDDNMAYLLESDNQLQKVALGTRTNIKDGLQGVNIPFTQDNVNPEGSDTTSEVANGTQPASDWYYTAQNVGIYFVDEDSNYIKYSGKDLNLPITYDPDYNLSQQVHSANLQSPAGYNILPENKQDYNIQTGTNGKKILNVYVALQKNPTTINVKYYDPNNRRYISSDKITTNQQGSTAKTGDSVNLPTPTNANSNYNLSSGYRLDSDQISTYQIRQSDYDNPNHTKDLTLLVNGNPVSLYAPVTIDNVDSTGHVQSIHEINIPINGNVGDYLRFSADSFAGYIPAGYHLATGDNNFNHTDYSSASYYAKLTPSDASQWNSSDTWKRDQDNNSLVGTNYWDSRNDRPLAVIQANSNESIMFNLFNQNNKLLKEAGPVHGDYGDTIDTSVHSPYIYMMPAGYSYDTNHNPANPSQVSFGLEPKEVSIYAIGNPEKINVEYDFDGHKVNDTQSGNVDGDMQVTTNSSGQQLRIGDIVSLPVHSNQLPVGYSLANGAHGSYDVENSDDPSHTGTITEHIPVKPEGKVLPVIFMNQDNKIVDTHYSTGYIGEDNVNYPHPPAGYNYSDSFRGRTYSFTQSQINPNSPEYMQPVVARVIGDAETVPVRYIDQNGQLVTGHSDNVNNLNDRTVRIGDTIPISDAQAPTPSGYTIDNNQPNQYQLWDSDVDTARHGYMNPVNIYVRATKQTYQFVVQAHEYNHADTRIVNTVSTPVTFSDSDGAQKTFNPSDYVPTGYSNDSSNQAVTVKVTDHGLVNAGNNQPLYHVNWKYQPQENNNAFILKYMFHGNEIGSDHTIPGHVGDNVDLTHHVPVPSGYYLDAGDSTNYVVPAQGSKVVKLNVHQKNSNVRFYNIHVKVVDPQDHEINHYSDSVPITVPDNNSQNIQISKYYPNSDTNDYTFKSDESSYDTYNDSNQQGSNSNDFNDGIIKVTNNAHGLSSRNANLTYMAKEMASDSNIQPITVNYINQTGNVVQTSQGSKVIKAPSDYEGQTIDVTKMDDGGLTPPQGYRMYRNQKTQYSFSNQAQTANIYVEGNPVNALAPIYVIHVDSDGHNQNPNLTNVSDVIKLPIRGQVGDVINVNDAVFNNYLPEGYTFANSYHGNNYDGHTYTALLTPSDSVNNNWGATESSHSWQNSHLSASNQVNGAYWDNNYSCPLIALQADSDKQITFGIFNQNKDLLSNVTTHGDYNDRINTSRNSPYMADMMSRVPGYYYDVNNPENPSSVKYDIEPKDVALFALGRQENVEVKYTDGNQTWSTGGIVSGHRIGDTIQLPTTGIPQGYHLGNNNLGYTLKFSDDPSHVNDTVNSGDSSSQVQSIMNDLSNNVGTITKTLNVVPNTYTLPVKFIDQNGQQVGSTNYQTKANIGDQNVSLPNAPTGYTLNSALNTNTPNNQYNFDVSDIDHNNKGFLKSIPVHVLGDPATIKIKYVDRNGVQRGSDTITGKRVGDIFTMPVRSSDAYSHYNLSPNYILDNPYYEGLVQTSDANGIVPVDLNVIGKTHDVNNLSVKVVYSDQQGNVTASNNNVPVTVTGQIGSSNYFNPSNLAVPAGYQLDMNQGKTHSSYLVNINSDGGSWQNGQPVIYFVGNNEDNDQLIVNQIVRSSAGTVLNITRTPVSVHGSVGDSYQVDPNQITKPSNSDVLVNAPSEISGKILANGNNTYLSQPTDTLNYVDYGAKSNVTVHYINQNHRDVGQESFTQPCGSTLNNTLISGSVPTGYTESSNNPSQVKFGKSDEEVDINVAGQPAGVSAEYYNGNSNLGPAGSYQGRVGDTITLPANNVPAGYHLIGNVPYYTLQSGDSSSSTIKKIPVSANEMTMPIIFKNQDATVGQTDVYGKRDSTQNVLTDNLLPQGYHYDPSVQPYGFKNDSVRNNATSLMNSDSVAVDSDSANVEVHVKDENGSDLTNDDYQLSGSINGSDRIHNAPSGYSMDSGQPTSYRFDASNIQSRDVQPDTDQMKPITIYVHHNSVSASNLKVHIVYENADGTVQKSSDRTVQFSGVQGHTMTFDPHSLTVPSGYNMFGRSETATLINPTTAQWNTDGHSEPRVNFVAMSSQYIPNHTIHVTQVEEAPSGHIIGVNKLSDSLSDLSVGNQYNVSDTNSNIPAPAHFQLKDTSQNHSITGVVTGNGLSNDRAVLYYVAKPADPIDLHFKEPNSNYDIKSDLERGYYGSELDAMDYLPAGYHLTEPGDAPYLHFKFQQSDPSYPQQNETIDVASDSNEVNNRIVTVHLHFVTPQGSNMGSRDVPVTITPDDNGYFHIFPNEPVFTQYTRGFHIASGIPIGGNVRNHPMITSNPDKTFTYMASGGQQHAGSINVEFMNKNGEYVGEDGTLSSTPVVAGSVSDGYYHERVNDVTNTSQHGVGVPNGYQLINNGDNLNQIFNGQTQNVIVMVKGKSASPVANIKIVKENQNHSDKQSDVIHKTISGSIGDSDYSINANDYLPAGYNLDTTQSGGDNAVNESIEPDGHLSQSDVTFYYVTQGLKPIDVVYENEKDHRLINASNTIQPGPSDYAGEQVNLTQNVSPSVLSNYKVDPNYDSTARFSSNESPRAVVWVIPRSNGQTYNYKFHVIKQFYSDQGQNVLSTSNSDDPESGIDGASFAINPPAAPAGYNAMSGNNQVNGYITSDGLTNNSVVYKFEATNSSNGNQNPGPNGTPQNPTNNAQPIFVTYKSGNNVLSSQPAVINGDMGQMKNIVQADPVPSGYHLDASQQTDYQIQAYAQNVTLQVSSNSARTADFNLTIKKVGPQGQNLGESDKAIPISLGTHNEQLNDNLYNSDPGYFQLDASQSSDNGNITVSYNSNNGQLTSTGHTLVFVAKQNPNNDGLGDVHVTYKDGNNTINQAYVNGSDIYNGFLGEKVSANDIARLAGPKSGYHLTDGSYETVTLVDRNHTANAVFEVAGDEENYSAKITIQESDPNHNVTNSYPIYIPVSGTVGSGYRINAQDLTPKGYSSDLSVQGPQFLSGIINSDGLSQRSATFKYHSNAQNDPDQLKPINVILLDNGEQVGTSSINAQSGDYAGRTINAASRVSVSENYHVVNGQNVPVAFSGSYSPTAYVNVERNSGSMLHEQFNVIENFYDHDGTRLMKTSDVTLPVSGEVNQHIPINLENSCKVNGYTLMGNPVPVDTTITSGGLINGTAVCNYQADSDTSDSYVQPIYITYKDGNQTIGSPNQVVHGYMGEQVDMVNVLRNTQLNGTYQITDADRNLVFTMGHNPQHHVIEVVPKFGEVTIHYVDISNGNHNQLPDTGYAYGINGQDYNMLKAINSVPYGYHYAHTLQSVSKFNHGNQNVFIGVVPNNQRVYGNINVKYVDRNSHELINQQTVSGRIGNSFNWSSYEYDLPDETDYGFAGVHGSAPSVFKNEDQQFVIYVSRHNS